MATRKIAPALAAGCPVVIKPAPQTPLTTLLAVQLALAAGVPENLVQVVTTTEAPAFSSAVLADPRARKVSFTGSTAVGKVLLHLAADNVLKSSMELGGNAPLLIFDDADLERAVDGAFAAKMRNGGQSCIAANRIFVQDGIADAFTDALTDRLAAVKVGNGLAPGVGLGPVIDHNAVTRLSRLVEDATRRGAHLLTGGSAPSHPGTFFEPTLTTYRLTPTSPTPRSSGPSPQSSASPTRTRPSPAPTTPSTAWRATSSPRTSTAPSTWPTNWPPAWSASTRASPRTRPHLSAASSSPASDARAAAKDSRNTRRSATTTSNCAPPHDPWWGRHPCCRCTA
ncbi:hypothetical protein GCM10010234_09980 [Streptomyces hawaiiensis]